MESHETQKLKTEWNVLLAISLMDQVSEASLLIVGQRGSQYLLRHERVDNLELNAFRWRPALLIPSVVVNRGSLTRAQ